MALDFPTTRGACNPVIGAPGNTDALQNGDTTLLGNTLYTFVVSGGSSWWTANVAASPDNRYVNVTGDTMTGDLVVEGDVRVESLNGGPLAGFRNQLINGSLVVNQRGQSTKNDTGYFVDRWTKPNTCHFSWVGMDVLDYEGNGFRLTNLNGQANGLIRQAVEIFAVARSHPFVVGSTWTLSMLSDNASLNLVNSGLQWAQDSAGTGAALASAGGGWVNDGNGRYTHTYTITDAAPAGSTCLLVDIAWATLNAAVGAIQLEPGPVATPFEHRPIGTELALCQRYYQRLAVRQTTNASLWYTFNTKMRATPTAPGGGDNAAVGTILDDAWGMTSTSTTTRTLRFEAEF